MNRIKLIFSMLLVTLFTHSLTAQSGQEAAAYMSDLTEPLGGIKTETWDYLKAVTRSKNAKKVESKRAELIQEIASAKKEISKKQPYHGDGSLRSAVVQYLDILHKVLKEDYDKILDMEAIAEQSYDLMEAYLLAKEKAGDKLHEASDELKVVQEQFAEKNNVKLQEAENDKTAEKIKKAGDALEYYNKVFLIFFKSYKQELYVLDAQMKGDVSALEQNVSTLESFAEEGLLDIKKVGDYKGDRVLIDAARNMLLFYKREAQKDFPAMVDFYIKKDNLEKIKQAVEAKSEKKRTQEDIDKYNAAIKEYNDAAAEFNKIGQQGNEERSKLLKEWNEDIDKFFDNNAK